MLLQQKVDTLDPDAAELDVYIAPAASDRPVKPSLVVEAPTSGGRYGEGRGVSLKAVLCTVGIHAVLLGGLLTLNATLADKTSDKFVAFDLASPTPPAPPQQEVPDTTPQPQQLAITPTPPRDIVPVVPITPITIATSAPAPVISPPPREPVEAAPAAPPARPAPPSMVSSADLGTRMISGRPPRYPVQSRRAREQGVVELLLVLGFDGAVENISVSRSSGFERLDEAALSAVRRWRWEPTLSGGEPV
ncbi:MAG: energy transducer TonB, partial [Marmoricola sp.]|nr:energy transducer TonB [Marmoricola sp.]